MKGGSTSSKHECYDVTSLVVLTPTLMLRSWKEIQQRKYFVHYNLGEKSHFCSNWNGWLRSHQDPG